MKTKIYTSSPASRSERDRDRDVDLLAIPAGVAGWLCRPVPWSGITSFESVACMFHTLKTIMVHVDDRCQSQLAATFCCLHFFFFGFFFFPMLGPFPGFTPSAI